MASITYIVDDSDPDIKYLCSTTHAQEGDHSQINFYDGTWSTIANGTDCSDGWFQYTFNGTSVDVPVTYSQLTTNYSLTVDGNKVVSTDSLNFADGEHTLVYATSVNASLAPTFDFLTVVAGTTTRMKGRNVILDDTDSAITYTGDGWQSTIFPNNGLYKDTVHFMGHVGDTLSFEFPGSLVFIYTLHPFSQTGSLTLKQCVKFLGSDGDETQCASWTVSNNDTRSSGVGMVGDGMGGFTKQGVHKMSLSITNVTDDYSIGFDFATYEAIFDSIDAIPTTNSGKSIKHVGAIVGGVIGGVAFVALVILTFVWWRRSRVAFTKKSSPADVGAADSNVEKEGSAPRS